MTLHFCIIQYIDAFYIDAYICMHLAVAFIQSILQKGKKAIHHDL